MFGLMTVAEHDRRVQALNDEWSEESRRVRDEANTRVEQWRTLALEAIADNRAKHGFAPAVADGETDKASTAQADAKAAQDAREKRDEARREAAKGAAR